MKPATAPGALKVQDALGPDFQVLEFEASTRTSEDAAAAIGCTVAEIASERGALLRHPGSHSKLRGTRDDQETPSSDNSLACHVRCVRSGSRLLPEN